MTDTPEAVEAAVAAYFESYNRDRVSRGYPATDPYEIYPLQVGGGDVRESTQAMVTEPHIVAAITAAVEAEREACAKLIEDTPQQAWAIAAAIRERGKG